jgi:hypothetical protein
MHRTISKLEGVFWTEQVIFFHASKTEIEVWWATRLTRGALKMRSLFTLMDLSTEKGVKRNKLKIFSLQTMKRN